MQLFGCQFVWVGWIYGREVAVIHVIGDPIDVYSAILEVNPV